MFCFVPIIGTTQHLSTSAQVHQRQAYHYFISPGHYLHFENHIVAGKNKRPTRTVAGLGEINRDVTGPVPITLDDRPDDAPAASGTCARFP